MAGHLCFGGFLKILSLCSPRSTTNKFLCGTMFLAVNPLYDIREDDGTVGHLINCSFLFSSRSKSQCVCVKCRKISSNTAMVNFSCG